MNIAALITLVCTALTGLVVLSAWLTRGDVRRARSRTGRHRRLPPTLVFSHVTLAIATATAWLVHVITDYRGSAPAGLVLLVMTAALGITMFVRWIPTYRQSTGLGTGPGAAHRAPESKNLPIAAVAAHGVFAVATLVLIAVVVLF
ncbi:hypothetical protein HH308_18450 [Gordonia sp. TBRC 11910]|uniref:DUF2269 domain-containing protein n=1 Tax=Gordonia asplenii TaxID=2725283 RepID=A0A848L6G5_9ACTN|nr:hypothetical protein [Gordonia asplenii]NMO03198.1 hypothetical protein [Gordonia asplenii]